MSLQRWMENAADAEEIARVLRLGLQNGNAAVLAFCRDHVLPKYRGYGCGYEPVELDQELIAAFSNLDP